MSIELRELRWAVAAAQHKSLRRAAEALNIRQSTLSRALRGLEDKVGAALFERTNGGTRLTCAGAEFVEFARRIIDDTESSLRHLRSRSRGENGRLRVGIYAAMAAGNLHATLGEYRRRFPDVDVYTTDGSHIRLIRALERNALDVAIMTSTQLDWDCRELSLWTERVIVALPEDHALAEHHSVSWRQLSGETLIFPFQGPGPELEGLLAARLNGDKPRRVLHHEAGLDRLLTLVSTGHGLLLMLEGGTGLKLDGVIYREILDGSDPTRLAFVAYWRPTNGNPTLEPFLKMLRERYPDFTSPLAPN